MKTFSTLFLIALINSSNAFAESRVDQKLEIKGSSTIYPLCKALSPKYYAKTQKVVLCEGGGSSNGIKFALANENGVGSVSRELTNEELAKGLLSEPIAQDGLAFVIHGENKISNITTEQLKKIFLGQISNWSEVDKDLSGPIILMGPNQDHGTFDSLISFLGLKDQKISSKYQSFLSHNETMYKLNLAPGSLGVVPIGFWSSYLAQKKKTQLRALMLENVVPSAATVLDKSYKASRVLNLVHQGATKPELKKFLEFIHSKEGEKITQEQGFVPLQKDRKQ